MTVPLPQLYEERIAADRLRPAPAQRQVLVRLEALRRDLDARPSPPRLFRRPPPPRGVYIWGAVGRGKSMLMDLFLDSLAMPDRRRVHFHDFMLQVHAALHEARGAGEGNPIAAAAQKVTRRLRLLALDELEVVDIVDAMIVGRLFDALLDRGLVLVVTSNRPPAELYRDGLKRELFLPFVDLIEERLDVLCLGGGEDYRDAGTPSRDAYLAPGEDAASRRDATWDEGTPLGTAPGVALELRRHPTLGRVARASFENLCNRPLGARAYLSLAGGIDTLILEHVPVLTASRLDAARRLQILVDVLYDARVRLLVTAEADPDDLFPPDVETVAFGRAASRLREMRSETWPDAP